MEHSSNKTILIENLPENVTNNDLLVTFENFGRCQIIELNKTDKSNIYSFVEFLDQPAADKALAMDGIAMGSNQIKVSMAFLSSQEESMVNSLPYTLVSEKVDYSQVVQIFIGDLSFDVNENMLKDAFSKFGLVLNAKVVRNADGSSKGFGFVSFGKRSDAERAIKEMHKAVLYNKQIKCNWATRNSNVNAPIESMQSSGGNQQQRKSYQEIFSETDMSNTDVYIAGQNLSEDVLKFNFKEYGRIVSIKAYPEKGHAFIRFDSHEAASYAIYLRNGCKINNGVIKCNWGRRVPTTNAASCGLSAGNMQQIANFQNGSNSYIQQQQQQQQQQMYHKQQQIQQTNYQQMNSMFSDNCLCDTSGQYYGGNNYSSSANAANVQDTMQQFYQNQQYYTNQQQQPQYNYYNYPNNQMSMQQYYQQYYQRPH